MPGNEPKKEAEISRTAPNRLPNVDRDGQRALPSVPTEMLARAESDGRETDQDPFQFDRKVREYGEELKKELVAHTEVDFFGNLEWKPYQIRVDHIPSHYHDRVAHYLLQAYQLTAAELHVVYNAPLFHNLDRASLAHALVARGYEGVEALARNLHNFKGVDEEFLLKSLLGDSNVWSWIDKVDFFTELPHRRIAEEVLRDPGNAAGFFSQFDKLRLSEDDHRAIVEIVLAGDREDPEDGIFHRYAVADLVEILHKMKGVDHELVMMEAIKTGAVAAFAVGATLPDIRT